MADVGRPSLCSRCGGSDWEELSDTEIRCAQCGLDSTRVRLEARGVAPSDPGLAAQIRRRDEILREHHARAARLIAEASFLPYGLDPQWSGRRWLGGWGGSDDGLRRIELGHGDDPRDPAVAQIRIETQTVSPSGGDPEGARRSAERDATQRLVHHFWHETGTLPDAIRRAMWPPPGRSGDPAEPWNTAQMPVDGQSVIFRVLAHDDFWVGRAMIDDAVIAVQARGWPRDTVALIAIGDIDPYVDGSAARTTSGDNGV